MSALRAGDDDPVAYDNEELHVLWQAVTGAGAGAGAGADAGVSARSAAAAAAAASAGAVDSAAGREASRKRTWTLDAPLLGVREGESSFEVPGLSPYKNRRVLPEDGTYVAPDADPTEGGRYGTEWRTEQITREKILEDDPNYKFIVEVAGRTNADVERLYDDDSVARAMQARLGAEQVRQRVAETRQSAEQLEGSVLQMERVQADARQVLGMITERRRTDNVLRMLRGHAASVRQYVATQRVGVLELATGTILETGPGVAALTVPANFGSIIDQAAVALFSDGAGVDMEADDPDMGFTVGSGSAASIVAMTPEMVVNLVFSGATVEVRPPAAVSSQSTRAALAFAFSQAFGRVPSFVLGEFEPAAENTRDGPRAIRDAVRRLAVLRATSDDAGRDADVLGYVQAYIRNKAAAARTFAGKIDGELLDLARTSARANAVARWVREAGATVGVLDSAYAMHNAESLLEAPRTSASSGANSSVVSIAEAKRAEAVQRARLAGATEAEALVEGQRSAAEVLAMPPNHIFAVATVVRDAARDAVAAVTGLVAVAEQSLTTGTTLPSAILRGLGVLGSRALNADASLRAAVTFAEGDAAALDDARATDSDVRWATAMAWYKVLGGTLFEEQRAWEADFAGGIPDLGEGVNFPANADARGPDPPAWGLFREPPAQISVQMQGLWNLHVPVLRAALPKIAVAGGRAGTSRGGVRRGRALAVPGRIPAALSAQEEPPALVADEIDVFTVMSGGVRPEDALRGRQEFGRTRWPLFVFMGRLLETDMTITARTLQSGIRQRATLIASTRERINAIRTGIPLTVPTTLPPYQHRRGWVEQPANSGVVKLKPIVTSAISAANNDIRLYAPYIAVSVGQNLEVLQHNEATRGDFAELVAAHMASFAHRFPKQYTQLGTRVHNTMDRINAIDRFKHTYNIQTSLPPIGTLPTQQQVQQVRVERVSLNPASGVARFHIL